VQTAHQHHHHEVEEQEQDQKELGTMMISFSLHLCLCSTQMVVPDGADSLGKHVIHFVSSSLTRLTKNKNALIKFTRVAVTF